MACNNWREVALGGGGSYVPFVELGVVVGGGLGPGRGDGS